MNLVTMILLLSGESIAFPQKIYNWNRIDTASYVGEALNTYITNKALEFQAYGIEKVYTAKYEGSGQLIEILLWRISSPRNAFGVFTLKCGRRQFHGTIGDAFVKDHNLVMFTYGPFFCEMVQKGGRRKTPPEDVFVTNIKKMLYTWADCYSMEIPLPADERILGSERFLNNPYAWNSVRTAALDPILSEISTRQAFTAFYRKSFLKIERALYIFLAETSGDKDALFAKLCGIYSSTARSWLNECMMESFSVGGTIVFLAQGSQSIILVKTDPGDTGCCEWVKDIQRQQF